jgi:hypothetical protein
MGCTRTLREGTRSGKTAIVLVTNRTNSGWSGQLHPYQDFNVNWATNWDVDGSNGNALGYAPITLNARETRKFRITGDDILRAGYLDVIPGEGCRREDIDIHYFYEARRGRRRLRSR